MAAVRRLAYEAADCGLLSPELAAGIHRVKGVRKLGSRLGNCSCGRIMGSRIEPHESVSVFSPDGGGLRPAVVLPGGFIERRPI